MENRTLMCCFGGKSTHPFLSEMAQEVLATPISSECPFRTVGGIVDSFRSSLTPKFVQALVCLQNWLKSEPQPIILRKIYIFVSNLNKKYQRNFHLCKIANSLLNIFVA